MVLHEGYFSSNQTKVCKLNKALYGLKQASQMCNEKLVGVLLEFGLCKVNVILLFSKPLTNRRNYYISI
jgi:hypothetical protein